MAHVSVREEVELTSPTMVEGLPGVGLVGKIATDHLIGQFDMTHYANVHCESLPKVATYGEGDAELRTPVRLYADGERDLLALRSDVPISPAAAIEFGECLESFLADVAVFPIYLSGLPVESVEEVPDLQGVGVGSGVDRLREAGIGTPREAGLISGPTGALLSHALEEGTDAVGLVVESDPRFPDPGAARVLIRDGIEPLTGLDVSTDDLVDRADEIQAARERLAERMQEVDEESTQARPLRMYQ